MQGKAGAPRSCFAAGAGAVFTADPRIGDYRLLL